MVVKTEQEELKVHTAMCYTCEFKPGASWFIATVDILTFAEWLEKHKGHYVKKDYL